MINYDPNCAIIEEYQIMESYMEKIRDEVLERLSPMEIAALFENVREFIYRWKEEEDIKRGDSSYE